MARKPVVTTPDLTLGQALKLAADAGVNFTDAEVELAKVRVADDLAVHVLEGLLDERVGPSCRELRPYPDLVALTGVEPTVEVPDA